MFRNGYGKLSFGGKVSVAHRAAYEVFVGPIPDGLFVCHRCDNRRCVNPEHLFVGTRRDNTDDMLRKRRQAHGLRSAGAKLSDDQVREIRRLRDSGLRLREVADRFGVSEAIVSLIARNKSHKLVT